MKTVSRDEARRAGLVRYFTGKRCKRGHLAERVVSSCGCVECQRETVKRWAAANSDRVKEWVRNGRARYEARHPGRVKAAKQNYKLRHTDRLKEQARTYSAKHRDAISARRDKWLETNPHARSFWQRTRMARQMRAMPAWADAEKIRAKYAEAAALSRSTGVKHSVDHFYPLAGKSVCGLHVEFNLRVIPLAENVKKGNRVPPSE